MKKPTLTDALASRAAAIAPGAPAAPPAPQAQAPRQAVPPSRRGTKAMTVHVDPAVSKTMRAIALDHDTSLQALLLEAVNDCLVKYGKPPIA